MTDCKHLYNAHRQCQWCHRMRDDIELEHLREEVPKLREEIELYEAMKEGVSVRIADLEQENAKLRSVEDAHLASSRMDSDTISDLEATIEDYEVRHRTSLEVIAAREQDVERLRQENAKLRDRVAELEAFIDSPEDVLKHAKEGEA